MATYLGQLGLLFIEHLQLRTDVFFLQKQSLFTVLVPIEKLAA